MNENVIAGSYNSEAYKYLLLARNAYQQYLLKKQRLNMIDSQIAASQNMYANNQQLYNTYRLQLQNNRIQEEMQMRQIIETIASNTSFATVYALLALQISVTLKDQISAMLHDNVLTSICSFIELSGLQGDIHIAYKRYCGIGGVLKMTSDILACNVMSFTLPGILKLQRVLS